MSKQPILFHGTNSKDNQIYLKLGRNKVAGLGRKWTVRPEEAMTFACDSAKKYQAEMVLIVLPKWNIKNFLKLEPGFITCNRDGPSDWYMLDGAGKAYNPRSLEQRSVEIYSQAELGAFIETYCADKARERRFLENYLEVLAKEKSSV